MVLTVQLKRCKLAGWIKKKRSTTSLAIKEMQIKTTSRKCGIYTQWNFMQP
jgi:hypothetical protein